MKYWLTVVLVVETCVFIHASYYDERCFGTKPCHRHSLRCNEESSNRIIAIADAKFGFKTRKCNPVTCDSACCKEEVGDCFESFSKNKPAQKSLYEKCEFKKECKLDSDRILDGCNGGRSTYSRIEYDCLDESTILRTAESLRLKKLSLLFDGAKFRGARISCSIRSNVFLRVTNYYTKLGSDGSQTSDFFNATDCTIQHKMHLQSDDGNMLLCHEDGEFFYSQNRDIRQTGVNLNLVIDRLAETHVIWLGFFAPQADGFVDVTCENLDRPAVVAATASTIDLSTTATNEDQDAGVYIGVGVGLLVLCILIVILVFIFRRRKKSIQAPVRKYSEVAVDEHDDTGHYASADENIPRTSSREIHSQVDSNVHVLKTGSKSPQSDNGYTFVDKDYIIRPDGATTSSDAELINSQDSDAYTYVDSDHLKQNNPDPKNVCVVELQIPDSSTYNHVVSKSRGKSEDKKIQGPVYSEVKKPKKMSTPKPDEYTEPDLKIKGDNSNIETDESDLEDSYNHLGAFIPKSKDLKSDKIESDYDHMDNSGKVNSCLKDNSVITNDTYSHIN